MKFGDGDYSNTVFYKICCKDTNFHDTYIGHTIDFVKRKNQHKKACNKVNNKLYNLKLYKTIRQHGGWENWNMEIIGFKNCKDHLEACTVEQEYFDSYQASLSLSLNSMLPRKSIIEYKTFNKSSLSDDKMKKLYKHYEILNDLNYDELQELEKFGSKDQASYHNIIRIKKHYFMTLFNKFNPKIFHKLFCDDKNKHIIVNLYIEKNKTNLDEMYKDITQANRYTEFMRDIGSKLYYIKECNKLLNIEHSNVEVESISIEDIKGLKDFVKENKKDIQIAFNMTCSREFDIIKNIYSKWSGTIIKLYYKGKQKRPHHYQITQPEINKNLYDKLNSNVFAKYFCNSILGITCNM
tara:strand:+ start:282 stop:1337 length:1056 start_codon:yes stop_codon:yes gene_type:complete